MNAATILLATALGLSATGAARAGSVSPRVTISEVLYDASGADDGQVFVELYGAAGGVLDGYRLEGVNGANGEVGPLLELTGSIPLDGVFLLADAFADGTTAVPEADQLLDFDLQNGPDSLRLLDAAGQVVDALGYGVFGEGEVFAGEGDPAPDGVAGQSLARRFADLDGNDNARDFVLLDSPTPGVASVSAPEPARAVLLLGAVCALIGRRFSS